MTPDRKYTEHGFKVEEYYWNGRQVVYVNNRASDLSFEEAKATAPSQQVPS